MFELQWFRPNATRTNRDPAEVEAEWEIRRHALFEQLFTKTLTLLQVISHFY